MIFFLLSTTQLCRMGGVSVSQLLELKMYAKKVGSSSTSFALEAPGMSHFPFLFMCQQNI